MNHPPTDRATLAVVLRARGLRGEVITHLLTDFPEHFDELEDVWLQYPSGDVKPVKLEESWFQNGTLILKFEGIDTRTQAEALAKCKVQIPSDERVELEDDEFFVDSLIGCQVELADGQRVGQVVDVLAVGGGDTLVVHSPGTDASDEEREHLIPFVESICSQVDVEARRIVVTPPEGLLEL
ncbi:MAG TPA: ribosome maturation factor RimM [Acidobacteriota bacterium]|nr:ribosome maturation factor RimM [Acidobacteriota bacterium]HNB73379.1 ribosome maturation factor RimM [Acidobacteriota bacterium]HNG94926.1 ribosome maturation factor RimM [Acidobacteriota bacterium]